MPTAQPPVCLLPSHPVTATSLMMGLTLSPNKDAQLLPSSLSWTAPTGKGQLMPALFSQFWFCRTVSLNCSVWYDKFGLETFSFSVPHLGKRCAAGLSIRVGLERWLLTLDFSSLAAVPKNRRRWHLRKCLDTFQTHFLHSSQKMWKKTGDCFYWTPCRVVHGIRLTLSPVADLQFPVLKLNLIVRYFFST